MVEAHNPPRSMFDGTVFGPIGAAAMNRRERGVRQKSASHWTRHIRQRHGQP